MIIFRPHNIYGPNMGYNHVIPEIVSKLFNSNNELLMEGSGNQSRSFCYIDDFLNAFNLLLKKGIHKNIYNIGNEDEVKIIKLIKKLISISGKNLKIKKTNEKIGGPLKRLPDITKIKKLGYKQTVLLDEGLKKTFDWCQNYFKKKL